MDTENPMSSRVIDGRKRKEMKKKGKPPVFDKEKLKKFLLDLDSFFETHRDVLLDNNGRFSFKIRGLKNCGFTHINNPEDVCDLVEMTVENYFDEIHISYYYTSRGDKKKIRYHNYIDESLKEICFLEGGGITDKKTRTQKEGSTNEDLKKEVDKLIDSCYRVSSEPF